MIGEKILNYQIESLLGEGAAGTVYLATHTQLGRKVAIKVLNPVLVNNFDVRARFRNEAATLSALQHFNIITLYDYVEQDTGLYLIMEYAQGNSLDSYIQKISGPIPEQKTLYFFNQILDGLSYAHQKGIVHRDIKPANIIITQDADVKILDFGIAKILKDGHRGITKIGAQLGTVLYMSPEQVQGSPVDVRSDIYSLGVTLFEMLTGTCPYQNIKSEYEIYEKIIQEPLPSAQNLYPMISDRMQAVLDKATAKDPDKRFQTCEEFKQALNPTAQNHVVIHPPKESPEQHETIAKDSDKLKERRYTILYAALGLLVLVSMYFIYKGFSGKTKSGNDTLVIEDDSIKKKNNDIPFDDEIYEEEEVEEEKEKTPEEKLMDSLNADKKKIDEQVKLLKQDRKRELLKKLVIDYQFISNEFGEFVIQVTLANKADDVRFKDILLLIEYINNSDEKIKTREQSLEPLEEGKSISFRVREQVEAERFTCKLKSADPIETGEIEASPILDSLSNELEIIQEKMDKLKEEMEEKKNKEEDK
jgi:serine/threonine protein kinase